MFNAQRGLVDVDFVRFGKPTSESVLSRDVRFDMEFCECIRHMYFENIRF